MSELTNAHKDQASFRLKLLATVSAVALTGSTWLADCARASDGDADRPTLWIELGGQLSRLDDAQEAFSPHIMDARSPLFSPSQPFEKMPGSSIDETGKLLFQPDNSDWVLSASVRYGRSINQIHTHQQSSPPVNVVHFTIPGTTPFTVTVKQYPLAARFADTGTKNGESHAILDFQAGKDVGLGMFGSRSGSSIFSLGVRFAQFSRNSAVSLKSDPDFHRAYRYVTQPTFGLYHLKEVSASAYSTRVASMQAARSFRGIGPSLSWNASAALLHNMQDSELTFDWGVNAAVLFGRQRTKVHHEAVGEYHPMVYYTRRHVTYQPAPVDITRGRTVTVPNFGGFAGLSWRIQNFKVSAGYRADLFFGAMDGGIDTAKKENVGFYGPFASVSIGIGG